MTYAGKTGPIHDGPKLQGFVSSDLVLNSTRSLKVPFGIYVLMGQSCLVPCGGPTQFV